MATELWDLVEDPVLKKRVIEGVVTAIANSFVQDKSKQTQSEVTRRFQMIERYIREMRSDQHWAWQRILDEMPTFLRSKLDGIDWKPEQRLIWSPP